MKKKKKQPSDIFFHASLFLRKFRKCAPRLSPAASEKLSSHFVSIRRRAHESEQAANLRSSIPITVRQLEAIVRISESLAKLTLSNVATEEHVDEAIRLFLASTMDAVTQGSSGGGGGGGGKGSSYANGTGVVPGGVVGMGSRELMAEVGKVEEELRRRLPIGWSTSLATLRREFVEGSGYSEESLRRALLVLGRRDTVQIRSGGSQVYRSGA